MLTDAINYGALNVEELMQNLGVPSYLIPMIWDEYKKSHPTKDMSDWPPEIRAAYEMAMSEHKK